MFGFVIIVNQEELVWENLNPPLLKALLTRPLIALKGKA